MRSTREKLSREKKRAKGRRDEGTVPRSAAVEWRVFQRCSENTIGGGNRQFIVAGLSRVRRRARQSTAINPCCDNQLQSDAGTPLWPGSRRARRRTLESPATIKALATIFMRHRVRRRRVADCIETPRLWSMILWRQMPRRRGVSIRREQRVTQPPLNAAPPLRPCLTPSPASSRSSA